MLSPPLLIFKQFPEAVECLERGFDDATTYFVPPMSLSFGRPFRRSVLQRTMSSTSEQLPRRAAEPLRWATSLRVLRVRLPR